MKTSLIILLAGFGFVQVAQSSDCFLVSSTSPFPPLLSVAGFVNEPYGDSRLAPSYPNGEKLLSVYFKNQEYRDSPTMFFTGFLNAISGYKEFHIGQDDLKDRQSLYYSYRGKAELPEIGPVTLSLTPLYDQFGEVPIQRIYKGTPVGEKMFQHGGYAVINWMEIYAYKTRSFLDRLFSDRAYTRVGMARYKCYGPRR